MGCSMRSPPRLLLFIASLMGSGAPLVPLRAADHGPQDPQLEGVWAVESVELSGQAVKGLEGARLRMSGGKKTFTRPDGAVEKGVYSLDPSRAPKQMVSTTEGRSGAQRGIYAVEGDRLKICLTSGDTAPGEFSTRAGTDLLLIVLRRAAGQPETAPERAGAPRPAPAREGPSGTRSFRMGFTGFVHDTTPAAVADSRKFTRENGDLIAHHIEGVPWAEAHRDLPFPQAMLEEWEGKRSATPPRGKVYLAISPGRGDLKPAEKCLPL